MVSTSYRKNHRNTGYYIIMAIDKEFEKKKIFPGHGDGPKMPKKSAERKHECPDGYHAVRSSGGRVKCVKVGKNTA